MQLGGSQAILRFAPLQLRFARIATALQRYFCILLWQFNSKSIICFHIPLNPSVRRVRRVYTLILHFTYNYAIHFGTKTINPFCQCFLLVTFLSRKKSDKTHPLASYTSPRVLYRDSFCFLISTPLKRIAAYSPSNLLEIRSEYTEFMSVIVRLVFMMVGLALFMRVFITS